MGWTVLVLVLVLVLALVMGMVVDESQVLADQPSDTNSESRSTEG
jgi:hypothetical protein